LNKEEIIKDIKMNIDKLTEAIDPEFIVLTEAIEGESSDEKNYYMVMVSENIPENPKERIEKIKELLGEITEEIDIYIYKLLEFKNLLTRKQPYIIKAIEEGEIIHDKGTFMKIREAIQQGLKRIVLNEETIWDLR